MTGHAVPVAVPPEAAQQNAEPEQASAAPPSRRFEFLYFAVRNRKLVIGLSVLVYAIALRLVVRRLRPRLAIALLSVKLLAFLGLGWLAFAAGRAYRPDPIGFALGLTCFPVAAVWEAMRTRGRI